MEKGITVWNSHENSDAEFRNQCTLIQSRGRKQDHQSSSNKDTDEFLVISIGTPMDVPANPNLTCDGNCVQTIVNLFHFQCCYITKLECHTLYKSHRDLKQIPGR